MAVRTWWWDTAPAPRPRRFGVLPPKKQPGWQVGNAGDIYNRDLVRHLYGTEPEIVDGGRRILLVGSIVHRVQDGDIVAGVGTKGSPQAEGVTARIVGARGPLTVDVLREAGHDVSGVRFLLDPGLLIADVFPKLRRIAPKPGSVAFVPHYRERPRYESTREYDVLDVDQTPYGLARDIARHETIYASSLHGVIFAHALGRPAVLVAPQTAEPEIKYRDYFASVGLPWRTPGDISESLRTGAPTVPSGLDALIRTAEFPTLDELRAAGIAD